MIKRFVTSLEMVPMSIVEWLAAFTGVVGIRILLEAFSNPDVKRAYLDSALPTMLHYLFFYLGAVTATVVCVSVVTRLSPLRMMRAIIFILPIIWVAPLIDLTYGGARIAYIFATPTVLLKDFFTFFGPLTGFGATLGLRIELALLMLMLGGYAYLHTKRLSSALFGMGTAYILIFITMSLPSLLVFGSSSSVVWGSNGILQRSLLGHNSLYPLYNSYTTSSLLFDVSQSQVWYVVFCIAGLTWLYLVRKHVVRAIVQNIRPERVMHFLVAGLLGGFIALSAGTSISWTIFDFITITTAILTIVFAWVFAVVMNDLVDEPIDAISNTGRPLVTNVLTKGDMREAGIVAGLAAFFGALTLGSYATFWVLIFSAAYYIYSVPPLRLKRVPILASILIGIATLAMLLLGFFLVSSDQLFSAFPARLALLVVLFMTLITNVRDLKDIAGDTAEGILTLPTMLGDHKSRMVIGGMTFGAYVLVPLFIPVAILWVPSLLIATVSLVGIVQGRGEKFVFALYFSYLTLIVFILHFF